MAKFNIVVNSDDKNGAISVLSLLLNTLKGEDFDDTAGFVSIKASITNRKEKVKDD